MYVSLCTHVSLNLIIIDNVMVRLSLSIKNVTKSKSAQYIHGVQMIEYPMNPHHLTSATMGVLFKTAKIFFTMTSIILRRVCTVALPT